MSEHEASRVLPLSAEAALALATDVSLLPRWVVEVTGAEEPGPDRLRLQRAGDPRQQEVDGLWRTRPEQLRAEWGSAGTGRYSGWLQVADREDADGQTGTTSELTLHLSFFADADDPHARAGTDEALALSLDALAALAVEHPA